ncbi:hypothetical protein BJ165DRAFT_428564 [Panaeolus papilionaceus]|nr:hypothetical protein BJ165DRAFT_428564 [Panaeolus papilionaceus]
MFTLTHTMSSRLILQLNVEMPPNKKRRGLAGSIVSTALSAALIGTAVGLTVYRLWRDRGKEPEPMTFLPPPPPYQQGEWRPTEQPESVRVNKSRSRSPSVHESRVPSSPQPPQPHMTPRSAKRVKQVTTQQKRTATYQRRAVRARGHGHAHASTPSTASAGFSPRPEFDFASGAQEESGGVIEDQMDWIGDKLAMLIEQGKRALNAEVVVMSDAKEDEVDDGTGDWVEDEDESEYSRRGRIGSPASSIRSGKRGRRPQSIVSPPPPSSSTSSHLYGSALGSAPLDYTTLPYQHHQYSSASSSYPSHSRGMSHDSTLTGLGFNTPSRPARSLYASGSIASASSVSLATVQPEEPSAWESPEIRESMERARARFAMRRGG